MQGPRAPGMGGMSHGGPSMFSNSGKFTLRKLIINILCSIIFFFFYFFLQPFQDYFSSYETGQSVGGRKQGSPEKNHLVQPQTEFGLSHMWRPRGPISFLQYTGKHCGLMVKRRTPYIEILGSKPNVISGVALILPLMFLWNICQKLKLI